MGSAKIRSFGKAFQATVILYSKAYYTPTFWKTFKTNVNIDISFECFFRKFECAFSPSSDSRKCKKNLSMSQFVRC